MCRPKLLDLFCGAGGCAMGYHRAGFDVFGVDHKPQPRYPFEFMQADAMMFLKNMLEDVPEDNGGMSINDFSVVHASPPCQAYSQANNIHGRKDHPDLVGKTRSLLLKTGKVWVIENVPGAPLHSAALVCGLSLGLNVKRHRLFECSHVIFGTGCPKGHNGDWLLVFGHTVLERGKQVGTTTKGGPIIRRKHVGTDRGREEKSFERRGTMTHRTWMDVDGRDDVTNPTSLVAQDGRDGR